MHDLLLRHLRDRESAERSGLEHLRRLDSLPPAKHVAGKPQPAHIWSGAGGHGSVILRVRSLLVQSRWSQGRTDRGSPDHLGRRIAPTSGSRCRRLSQLSRIIGRVALVAQQPGSTKKCRTKASKVPMKLGCFKSESSAAARQRLRKSSTAEFVKEITAKPRRGGNVAAILTNRAIIVRVFPAPGQACTKTPPAWDANAFCSSVRRGRPSRLCGTENGIGKIGWYCKRFADSNACGDGLCQIAFSSFYLPRSA